ncbi:alpha/beta fold hydrolase [Amycolatopsis albispora]|uniref:AB hydrolase-1 domain-containing protein n=1 Tax=Amycolatopsis albispora TaxID=1804986 RepID=A0A344L8V2_9PSEU|nr:alpha/beta fold hydrolase [Amycolatopsis albispora]AXB44476.1 hypothetical protein A4R43_19780 [Amycolatopsis albispora]
MRETELQPHRIRWDRVEDRWIRSIEAGTRDREPVVLVPGLGALGYLLDTLDGCGARTRSYLLDLPGFGHRPPRPCPAEIPAIADTVVSWLAEVPGGPVVLVGHSTGAQSALRAAVAAPDRVRALVLLGPTMPPRLRTLPALIAAFVRNSRHEPAGEIPVTWPYYLRGGPRALLRYLRSAQRDEPERLIGEVACPILLVRGKNDAFAPRQWLGELAAASPRARIVTAPGAHAFPFQHGGLTAALIAEAGSQG